MQRNYKIIENHLYWGYEGDSSVGHAIVAGRLAAVAMQGANDPGRNGTPYASYEDYLTHCKSFGIHRSAEERYNELMHPQLPGPIAGLDEFGQPMLPMTEDALLASL